MASVVSLRRHNSGSGIAISSARSTRIKTSTLSIVLAICSPTTASAGKFIWCSHPASAEIARSAWA